MDPLDPWRAEAERRGFRLLDRGGGVERLISAGTFLDLEEAFGRFFSAVPRPRPPRAAGWVAANHMGELLAIAAKPVLPGNDPRTWRAGQERGGRRLRKK